MRIYPGRLSVSRSFGDVEAKLERHGGNPNVLIATPEIKAFKIKREHDFIVMACDGIFDRLSNKETIQAVWNGARDL
jgi:protein phosphatase 2C family protein 2/3